MASLLLTLQAELDLEQIYQHSFDTWGFLQAELYQDELFHAMELILNNPKMGQVYPYATIEYRKLHINRHLIFYRIENDDCIVIRILHDAMNLRDHMI